MRGILKVDMFGQKVRQSRLRWYGNVKSRDEDYVGRTVLEMQLLGKRKPKMGYLDVVKEDMPNVGLFHNHSDHPM